MNDEKLKHSVKLLDEALKILQKSPADELAFASASKLFEIVFEYAWKHLKRDADEAGYEAYNPRDVLKAAAQMRTIEDLELWKQFLNARNLSVHDYLGIDSKTFLSLMKGLKLEAEKLLGRKK